MPTGTLSYFNSTRGFGFLGRRPRGVFAHASAFKAAGIDEPQIGDVFDYDIDDSHDGRPCAVNLRRVEAAAA